MMQAFAIEDLIADNAQSDKRYTEFLRVPAMSAGVYVLPAQSTDLQNPHNQDEVYYVVRGRAKFQSGDTETLAVPGSLLYVSAHEDHRFFDIEEEIVLLVLFAPEEG